MWFVIAIARFRFPRSESIPSIIRRRYGDNVVKLIRKFERKDRQSRKVEIDLEFLEKCKEHSLAPSFLKFKVSNERLRNSQTYITNQMNFLMEEIKQKKHCHYRTEK